MVDGGVAIEVLFDEERLFPAPADFAAAALVDSPEIYAEGDDYRTFWAGKADGLAWKQRWGSVLDWSNPPFAKWFVGARLNVAENCLDRHLGALGDKVAFHWEGEPGDRRSLTYRELHAEVCQAANALKGFGVHAGDRVALFMGMVPELPVAMLACARIGAPHSVVFGGFTADALRDRIDDAQAKVLITCDGAWCGGEVVPLKSTVDAALAQAPSIEKVVVVRRTSGTGGAPEVSMTDGRDVWWDDVIAAQSDRCDAVDLDSEQPLFILYTSGDGAEPTGIVHTTGGYLVGVASTHRLVFDLKPDDVYWCTADIGWITGHSYVVYGPLANGTTSVMYEGSAGYPGRDRLWDIVERYRVSVFYTAPTAIRTYVKWGDEYPRKHDLTSLRLLGTAGESINPEAWVWYHRVIGGGRCPVVDTWWQTETGHIMISPLPGVTTCKPGSVTGPLPGIVADVVDESGDHVEVGGGYLVLTQPWPGMLRTLYNDPDRFVEVYWRRFSDPAAGRWVYFAGDGVKRDDDGYLWLLGRADDVLEVAGHRISTVEVESALVEHPKVAQAAVVGRHDEHTGQAIAAFVTLRRGVPGDRALREEIREHVASRIGRIAMPASIVFTDELPTSRSGKILRGPLLDISEHRRPGDLTTLANASVLEAIAAAAAIS